MSRVRQGMSSEHLLHQRDLNRTLLEKAMRMRVVSYLADAKAQLLIETVNNVGASKRTLLDSHRRLEAALQQLSQEESARRGAEQRLANVMIAIEHAPILFAVASYDGKIEYANAGFRELLRLEGEQGDIVASLEATFGAACAPLREALVALTSWQGELEAPAPDGERRVFLVRLDHLAPREAFAGGSAIVLQDVTESRDAIARLHQQQRLEAIGQMTGGVAHDVNNLLMVISAEVTALGDAVSDRPEVLAHLQAISDAVDRGSRLTRHMLAFAQKRPLHPTDVDVNAMVESIVRMMGRALGEQRPLALQLSASKPIARCDAGQLEAAITNLLINARDASPPGSMLTIRTEARSEQQERALSCGSLARGHYVSISVIDEGCGIASELFERIWEPFFSTKGPAEHSGLGLSMVAGFAQQSGGGVEVSSVVGRGTTMTIHLPILTSPSTEAKRVALLLEDDPAVRAGVARLLRGLGYEVREAATESEALALFPGPGAAAVLITDVVLAGERTGVDVASVLRERDPTLPLLFMSGYSNDEILSGMALGGSVQTLEKPFRREALAAALRALMV